MGILLFLGFIFSISADAVPGDVYEFNSTYIIGGNFDKIQNHPYLVALINGEGFWCCGSIVSPNHVLTAAHCIVHANTQIVVRAGSSFWEQGGTLHHVEYNLTHGNELDNDIGILRVAQPFIIDEFRQIIDIFYPKETTTPGTMALIAGWGRTETYGNSKQLKSTQLPIVDRETCNKIYKDVGYGDVGEGKLCAGFLERGGYDTCQGDSGGPMVIDGRQAGIVSMGHGCALPEYPGIYTEVAFYNEWIMEQISL